MWRDLAPAGGVVVVVVVATEGVVMLMDEILHHLEALNYCNS